MNEYASIGKIVATFGLGGDVILKHGLGQKTNMKQVKTVFIEDAAGSYIPWFVASSKAKQEDEMYLKLDGVDTKEAARPLTTKKLWVRTEDFRKLVKQSSPIALIGYSLYNEALLVGVIEEVIEQPHQVLLTVQYQGNEAYIPLHEETLESIDHRQRKVFVILPEGLLEIYGSGNQ